jgi:hypothetical protein
MGTLAFKKGIRISSASLEANFWISHGLCSLNIAGWRFTEMRWTLAQWQLGWDSLNCWRVELR